MNGLVCPKCGGVRKQRRDNKGRGRGWRCLFCENKRQRERRRENNQRLQLGLSKLKRKPPSLAICPKCGRDRRPRMIDGRKQGWRCHYCYRQAHKQQLTAHDKVAYALKTGRMVRQRCEICGEPNANAHHEDYSKPLDVRWLCSKHHSQLHFS